MLNLPIEVLDHLFHLFPLNQILDLRKVCQKFKSTVDQMKFNEISIFIGQNPFYETAYFTNKEIDLRCSLMTRSFDFLKEDYFKMKFRSLKRLFIFVSPLLRIPISLNDSNLDAYENLEQLELHFIYSVTGCLKLRNLNYLYIDTISKCVFDLSCPNLIGLSLDGDVEANLICEHASIRCLEVPRVLENFLNLQQLSSLTIYKLDSLDLYWLAELRHLKEFNIYSINQRETLDHLKATKDVLNLSDLKILFGGIDIDNNDLFNNLCSIFEYLFPGMNTIWSLNFLTTRLLRFYTRNSDHLRDLRFVEYLELEEIDMPEVLISKLFNLKTLYIYNECVNDEKFRILIQNCRKIRYLLISSLQLDQSQYDLIPIYLNNLRSLEIKRCNANSFEFVKFCKNIEFFGCTVEFNLIELKNIILNCKYLRTIKLKLELETFFISLINFHFKYLDRIYQFNTLNDLIRHIDNCNSFKELICKCFSF